MKRLIPILLIVLMLFAGCSRKTANDIGKDAFWWTNDKEISKRCTPFYGLDFMPVREN